MSSLFQDIKEQNQHRSSLAVFSQLGRRYKESQFLAPLSLLLACGMLFWLLVFPDYFRSFLDEKAVAQNSQQLIKLAEPQAARAALSVDAISGLKRAEVIDYGITDRGNQTDNSKGLVNIAPPNVGEAGSTSEWLSSEWLRSRALRVREWVSGSLTGMQNNLLRLNRLEFRGLKRVSTAELTGLLQLQSSPWIWQSLFLDIESILRSNPWVEVARVRFLPFPARAVVEIDEAVPLLIAGYEKRSWLVSAKGKLIQPLESIKNADIILESTELPRFDGIDDLSSAAELDSPEERFTYSMRALSDLAAVGGLPITVERYRLLANGAIVFQQAKTEGGLVVIADISSKAEAANAVGKLNAVLKDVSSRSEMIAQIDLRFKSQAIVRSTPDPNLPIH